MKMGESRENSDELLSKPTFAVLSAGLTERASPLKGYEQAIRAIKGAIKGL